MKTTAFVIALLATLLAGCQTTETFTTLARAGDTVALPVGMKTEVTRDNLTVTITPFGGVPVVYAPMEPVGTPVVRAVVNLYPDPLSRLVVGKETNQDMGTNAFTLGSILQGSLADGNKDWWNTVVFLDLPTTLTDGPATIELDNGGSQIFQPTTVDIVTTSEAGAPNIFDTYEGGPLESDHILSMERADYYSVNFSGTENSHAIQVDLTRTPGIGEPWLANPRGDIFSISWSDDGANMRVILIPTNKPITNYNHFKFYVTGEITGLTHVETKGYDIDGQLITSGITTTVLHNN